jgi:transposase
MRYPDGGGLTAQGRAKREAVRLQAAELFTRGMSAVEVAERLRVSTKSAYAWRREWMRGGTAALASQGSAGGPCKLTAPQLVRLQSALDAGPAVHGWNEDQRWTLARVAQLIRTLFHISYTPRGVSYLLHRLGWSPQVPVHQAAERGNEAIACTARKVVAPGQPPGRRRDHGVAVAASPEVPSKPNTAPHARSRRSAASVAVMIDLPQDGVTDSQPVVDRHSNRVTRAPSASRPPDLPHILSRAG